MQAALDDLHRPQTNQRGSGERRLLTGYLFCGRCKQKMHGARVTSRPTR